MTLTPMASKAVAAGGAQRVHPVRPIHIAAGESVIKCPSPLNVLKGTYDHSFIAVIMDVEMNTST